MTVRQKFIAWLEANRGLIIAVFCLPASFLFDLCLRLQHWFTRSFLSAPHQHDDRVRHIQQQIREWSSTPKPRPLLCTSRPNWLSLSVTFFNKSACHRVPVPLHHILKLDTGRQVIHVEPLVTVGEVTRFLNPRGYTLPVTLEISDATCGGLALATGMTTASHKFGLYQETIVSYDVVLGDGSLVTATKESHPDLFHCLPWSHGSLGILVALELQIVKVKPWVRLEYEPITGQKMFCNKMRELSETNVDFLEMTVFSRDEAVLMKGYMCDQPVSKKINHVASWYKPWFYKHVETFLKIGPNEEYIPLRDYLLRHNKAIFWVIESMIPWGNNPWFLMLFGWLLPPKPAFLKFTTTPVIRAMTFTKQVFQDIVLPMNQLEAQLDTAERLFNTFPLLVYPCRIYQNTKGQLRPPRPDQITPGKSYGMFNDLGVYGVPAAVKDKKPFDAIAAMREMEAFTRDVGGYVFLYADTAMTKQEFEKMFDLTLYEIVRKKYHAEEAFPHLYDKIKPEIDVVKVGKEYINPLY